MSCLIISKYVCMYLRTYMYLFLLNSKWKFIHKYLMVFTFIFIKHILLLQYTLTDTSIHIFIFVWELNKTTPTKKKDTNLLQYVFFVVVYFNISFFSWQD